MYGLHRKVQKSIEKVEKPLGMLNNPPDNWHFTVDSPPPKKKGVFFLGGSEFWDKIVNFWPEFEIDRTFRPRFGRFLHFKIQKLANIGHYYVILPVRTFYVQNSILV